VTIPAKANSRTALLHGPILPTMLHLTLPNLAALVVQIVMLVAELYFVSSLGTEAVAGIAVVIPILTLMIMMSHVGIGAGVMSAIARAIGGGRKDDADAILIHSLALSVLFGGAFSLALLSWGPFLYHLLGASDGALQQALRYSNIVFAGAVAGWTTNLLSAALRGSGNMLFPAIVSIAGGIFVVVLSPALIFGYGTLPPLGIDGAGIALLLYYVGTSVILLWYVSSGHSGIRLTLAPLRRRIFADIFKV